jgi:Family of unknown function (DUF6352)
LSGDFWLACGHHLVDRDAGGGLSVTDDFLKAYLARPELAPPADACPAERALHAALLAEPRRAVPPSEIAAIADADARENWQVMLSFRKELLEHATLEAAYLDLVRANRKVPHIFLNQLVQLILRNILDGSDDAFMLRAAELFFRPQRLALHEGSLIAADEETLSGLGGRPPSPLVSMLGLPAAADIDVLNAENSAQYWQRSDRFDMALDLSAGQRGLQSLAEVIRRFIAHLLGIEVGVEPLLALQNAAFSWYVGLDAEATRLCDALWRGDDLEQAARASVVGLYRLRFADPSLMLEKVRGEPVYLMAAMTADKVLRLKPQNLITGLPLGEREAVH